MRWSTRGPARRRQTGSRAMGDGARGRPAQRERRRPDLREVFGRSQVRRWLAPDHDRELAALSEGDAARAARAGQRNDRDHRRAGRPHQPPEKESDRASSTSSSAARPSVTMRSANRPVSTRSRKASDAKAQVMVYGGSSVVASAGKSVDVGAGMGTAGRAGESARGSAEAAAGAAMIEPAAETTLRLRLRLEERSRRRGLHVEIYRDAGATQLVERATGFVRRPGGRPRFLTATSTGAPPPSAGRGSTASRPNWFTSASAAG